LITNTLESEAQSLVMTPRMLRGVMDKKMDEKLRNKSSSELYYDLQQESLRGDDGDLYSETTGSDLGDGDLDEYREDMEGARSSGKLSKAYGSSYDLNASRKFSLESLSIEMAKRKLSFNSVHSRVLKDMSSSLMDTSQVLTDASRKMLREEVSRKKLSQMVSDVSASAHQRGGMSATGPLPSTFSSQPHGMSPVKGDGRDSGTGKDGREGEGVTATAVGGGEDVERKSSKPNIRSSSSSFGLGESSDAGSTSTFSRIHRQSSSLSTVRESVHDLDREEDGVETGGAAQYQGPYERQCVSHAARSMEQKNELSSKAPVKYGNKAIGNKKHDSSHSEEGQHTSLKQDGKLHSGMENRNRSESVEDHKVHIMRQSSDPRLPHTKGGPVHMKEGHHGNGAGNTTGNTSSNMNSAGGGLDKKSLTAVQIVRREIEPERHLKNLQSFVDSQMKVLKKSDLLCVQENLVHNFNRAADSYRDKFSSSVSSSVHSNPSNAPHGRRSTLGVTAGNTRFQHGLHTHHAGKGGQGSGPSYVATSGVNSVIDGTPAMVTDMDKIFGKQWHGFKSGRLDRMIEQKLSLNRLEVLTELVKSAEVGATAARALISNKDINHVGGDGDGGLGKGGRGGQSNPAYHFGSTLPPLASKLGVLSDILSTSNSSNLAMEASKPVIR